MRVLKFGGSSLADADGELVVVVDAVGAPVVGDRAAGGLDLKLEVWLLTPTMRAAGKPAVRLSHSNFRDSYWTIAQFVAHHTVGGCNLQPGDLLGSGTQSGPTKEQYGSLLELSWGGKNPVELPGGEKRTFLEDGDTLILKGACEREGFARIGFGEAGRPSGRRLRASAPSRPARQSGQRHP